MIWTTPPATRMSGVMTLALLTKTEPFRIRTVISVPSSDFTVVLLRPVEYSGVEPLTTWYSRTSFRVSTDAFAKTDAMLANPELFGAKMVTSFNPFATPRRPVALSAPYVADSLAATRAEERFVGICKTELMICIVSTSKILVGLNNSGVLEQTRNERHISLSQ